MAIEPIPRTLYTHPDKRAMVCLGDGSGWLVPAPHHPRVVVGWGIDPSDMESRSPALFGLTDDEILRLCRTEDIAATIAEIKAARHRRAPCKAAPVPRTLYHDPTQCKGRATCQSYTICLPDGKCWNLMTWEPSDGDVESWEVLASDLTDDEIDSLDEIGGRPERVAAILASRAEARQAAAKAAKAAEPAADKAAPAPKGRSTLYLTPREPAVLHESGSLWILYATGSELSPPRPVPSEWIEIAQDLTSAEVASLVDPDKRFLSIFKILSARKPAPGCDEAEVERWRKAAERAEADRQEWQALALNHEGAIERLTRERDAARESLSATFSALRVARAEADEAHRRADAAEPEVERLRGIVVALAARLAGL